MCLHYISSPTLPLLVNDRDVAKLPVTSLMTKSNLQAPHDICHLFEKPAATVLIVQVL